ncbi:LytR/AlgR family response regulator transcription factor [Paraurantiacibacter namhicola]|uniref:LytR/AlgR family response regulator transcription factor n=1 Tax=Paraurantiacibacter namhicola TaxID=645517 RepID=UPI00082D34A4|nr:LytTR family DNA-binding domain-containing protein [Paraurantiacibacter namhicola]
MTETPQAGGQPLRTLIVDDEPLAIERMQVLCRELDAIEVVDTASDGESGVEKARELAPDVVLLDMTMPGMDGLQVARALAEFDNSPAVIFVTAHEDFAVEAFDLEAVDYVLKPVAAERLERAIGRATSRRNPGEAADERWLSEFWVPHRSELLRIEAGQVHRIDAERDYVRLHVGDTSYLLLQTIAGLEAKLDPEKFMRIHRSTILRRDAIRGLRHEGLGVWSVELEDGEALRIGRTYLRKVKAIAGR